MLKLYYRLPNGKSFAHVSRSGTTTLAGHALKKFFPDKHAQWEEESSHAPQYYLEESWSNRLPPKCLVMVRNPVERLQSLIARNQYDPELTRFALETCQRIGSISRSISRSLSIVTFHHLAPIDHISDNDSHFIKFPKLEEACEYLGLDFDPSIHLNKQRNTVEELPAEFVRKIQDAIGIWKALK